MQATFAQPVLGLRRMSARLVSSLPVGWPFLSVLYAFPLWWLLGLGSFATILAAVPMAWELMDRRRLRLPKGMGLYLIFLGWVLVSAFALGLSPKVAASTSLLNSAVAYLYRLGSYVGALVMVLYVCTIRERELPSRRIVGGIAALWLVSVIGGFLGMILGGLSFTTPFEAILPHSVRSIGFVKELVHPGFAQVQNFLGRDEARPKAPFEYTNEWGGNLSILLPWAVVWWLTSARPLVRRLGPLVFAASLVPVVASLNRGLWACLVVGVVCAGVWLLVLGHRWVLGVVVVLGFVGLLALAVTPLGDLVQERLNTPHSNERRGYMVSVAIEGANESPIIGWGSTRPALGSDRTIAAGKSLECPQCGTPSIGTHGQLWLVLFTQGYVGAALFLSFFLAALWRYGRTADLYAIAASIGLVLLLVESTIYNQLPFTMWLGMLGISLAWRSRVAGGLAPLHRPRRLLFVPARPLGRR
jgi:hypothetical protein